MMGIKQTAQASVTEEEIHAMLEEGSEAGVIEQHQHEMVRNVFRLDDRQLGSLMIPRLEIFYIDIRESYEENMQKLIQSDHSRFPVCDGGLDNILGVTTAKKVLASVVSARSHDYTSDLQAAVFVPETLTGMELLEQFRNSNMHTVFVIDEYGELEGMVTLDDVLEALTGEFNPVNAEDAWAVQQVDGAWLLDGAIPVPELKDKLKVAKLPEEDKGRYHTLSGMIMLLLSRLPQAGDVAEWESWRFEVVNMDGKRIDRVMARRLTGDDLGMIAGDV